jgi:M6 family metalloprotease-like protein
MDAGAAETRSLEVRRVAPPATGRAVARPTAAAPMQAHERAALEARAARQRAFRAHEAELHRAAFKVGPTLAASRRRGWSPPTAGARRFATEGITAAGPTDTVRIACLRIDFLTDRGGSASSGDGHFNLAPADTFVNPVDRPPHNRQFYRKHGDALANYYDVQSYGRVRVEVDVWPAEQDSAYHLTDMADLGPWVFGSSIFRSAVDMMRKSFFAADSQSIAKSDRIPWDRYDRFMIIHAGSDLQSDINQNSKEDIPSFTMFVDDTDRVIFADSSNRDRPIDRVAFLPETINQDDAYGALNGVIAHENGHNLFGLGDVYDINTALPVVGWWSLMDSGNLVGSRVQLPSGEIFAVGLLPPSIDPFQRNFILDEGLLDYRIPGPTDTATFVLHGSARTNDFVKLDLSSDEYLILENRHLADAATVRLLRDDTTGVILGPKDPDRFEWDALLPGAGILAWHIDESVIPFLTSLRINPDFGFNSNPRRRGLQIIEADGLDDLGDLGSPDLLGGAYDPYQNFFAPLLSETTIPNLIPNQDTRPHLQVEFLDNARDDFRVRVKRQWQLAGWPKRANFPPGGPVPLAADLDGDGKPEVVWAGGDTTITDTSLAVREAVRDSAAVFAIRWDAKGVGGVDTLDFAHLDRRPRPEVAAVPSEGGTPGIVFATTFHAGAGDTQGGKLWAVRPDGTSLAGFPVTLPSPASTPPLALGNVSDGWLVVVGCEDGRVRIVDPNGAVAFTSAIALAGGVSGRLAAWVTSPLKIPPTATGYVAAGGVDGEVAVLDYPSLAPLAGWPRNTGLAAHVPDFLWLRLGGIGPDAADACADPAKPTLIHHHADRLWAWCVGSASLLPGWGTSFGDTIVAGLAAGDPDGDGFPEVIVQGLRSQLAYINGSGRPAPGWPRSATNEGFRTQTPPLAVDLDGNGRPEIVALNASGVLAALDGAGRVPDGWPLATGVGASGAMLAADLDADGTLEIVAPDRFSLLYAYSVPASQTATGSPWRMLGGDPGRSFALPVNATSSPGPATAGPLVAGSLKAYPNPARLKPVQFAYQLTADATVEFRILDSSGHEVARWSRPGQRSDNVETWDPSGVPAGLYVARVRFTTPAHGSQTASVPLGILR